MLRKIILIFFIILTPFLFFLSFPKFNQSYLAFLAIIPFYFFITNLKSSKKVIMASFCIGLLVNLGFFYWIVPTFQMAKINFFVALISCFLISAYLTLYWLVFGLSIYYFRSYYFLLAGIWVILEYLRTYCLSGFPWNLLGYSQWNNLVFIQSVDFFGVYGLSFLVIIVNFLFCALFNYYHGNELSRCNQAVASLGESTHLKQKKQIILMVFIIIANLIYGFFRLAQKDKFFKESPTVKIGLLQGNINQYEKFDNKYLEHIRKEYLGLMDQNIDLYIWPETAFPYSYKGSIGSFFEGVDLQAQIIGSFVVENGQYFNGAILLDRDLRKLGTYKKNHLVPFGEVLPFKAFIEKFLPAVKYVGGLNYGDGYDSLELNGVKFGTSICFETLFGNEIRQFVLKGANVLVNISNDAWYLRTSAPYQHFSFNIFRAIENRRYLVRAANTGISAVISATGKVLARTSLNEKECLVYEVPLKKGQTIYSLFGDWFVWLNFILVFYFLAVKYQILRFIFKK
ncbi:MAG: apolipoprotein N-acyltransferase [bacterium]|nr:apolipoprotein N-acyltransferase [bacterium]